ncbi:MAG: exodeoxyribonuclease VII large subunit, partial [bacterium]|nr:exodeoxyribonuclease VII large subunit [bacterium]
VSHTLYKKGQVVELLKNRLSDLSPISVLERGYSICFKLPEEKVISNSILLHKDDRVKIQFSKGGVEAKVKKVVKNDQ